LAAAPLDATLVRTKDSGRTVEPRTCHTLAHARQKRGLVQSNQKQQAWSPRLRHAPGRFYRLTGRGPTQPGLLVRLKLIDVVDLWGSPRASPHDLINGIDLPNHFKGA